jgi:5-hmdU DNA kinase-like protein
MDVSATSDDPIGRLVYWVLEREKVRIAKESGAPKPWTDDVILQANRFCNVRREDDPVTRYIKAWLNAHADDPDLWFAAAVARLTNEPATIAVLDWPTPWDEEKFVAAMAARRTQLMNGSAPGERLYNPAYVIPAGPKGVPTHEHLARSVLGPMWVERAWLRPREGDTLLSFYARLKQCDGIDDFLIGQIIADAKFFEPLKSAPDWQSWCIWGPGSMKGVNYLVGRDAKAPWKVLSEWRAAFDEVWAKATPELEARGIEPLAAHNRQNCNCEQAKWERVRRGEGRAKQKYKGAA